jgi:hypothetical protein
MHAASSTAVATVPSRHSFNASSQIPAGFTAFPVTNGIPMALCAKLAVPAVKPPGGRLYYMGQDRIAGVRRLVEYLARKGLVTRFVQSQEDGTTLLVVANIDSTPSYPH